MGSTAAKRKQRIGCDYVHSAVDDHALLAYCEIHTDEQGATAAGFLLRAAAFFASCGVDRIEEVMTETTGPTPRAKRSPTSLTRSGPVTPPSVPTVPGRTAKSNDSTAPSRPNGPGNGSASATTNAPTLCHHASSTTTIDADTPPADVAHPSAESHQHDG